MATATVALAAQNTLPIATAGVYELVYPHGNRISITNLGAGDVWVRFDGQPAAVGQQQSLHLPPDASVSNIPYHQKISLAASGAADVTVYCS